MRTPRLFVLISIAFSCAASTGAACAADDCVAKPNAPAVSGRHWYYRTDRNFKRQCWYLAPKGPGLEKSATETVQQTAAARPETVSSSASQGATTGSTGKPLAVFPIGFAPATVPGWPDATGGRDEPPSLQPASHPRVANAPRAAGAIAQAQDLPAQRRPLGAAAATLVVQNNHTFALIMLATVLLAIAGPVIHAARSRHQRQDGDRQKLGAQSASIVSTTDSHAAMTRDPNSQAPVRHIPQPPSSRDQTGDVAQNLQRLLDDMETRRSTDPV